MASTQKAIIYGRQSKVVRRFVIPDHGETVDFLQHVGSGEDMCLVPLDFELSVETANAEVERVTGVRPQSSRCEVVAPGGGVVGLICADPLLDSLPGFTLRRADVAVGPPANAGKKP